MTLTLFLFLLGLAGVLLVSLPLSIMIAEMDKERLWVHVRLWAIVLAAWAAVWVVMS
jgi:hypothetical protein